MFVPDHYTGLQLKLSDHDFFNSQDINTNTYCFFVSLFLNESIDHREIVGVHFYFHIMLLLTAIVLDLFSDMNAQQAEKGYSLI